MPPRNRQNPQDKSRKQFFEYVARSWGQRFSGRLSPLLSPGMDSNSPDQTPQHEMHHPQVTSSDIPDKELLAREVDLSWQSQ